MREGFGLVMCTDVTEAKMTVTLYPNQGPSGTAAAISVAGAVPGAPISLYVNGGIVLIADANGDASTTHTFHGQPGQVDVINAVAGIKPPLRTATSQFTITS